MKLFNYILSPQFLRDKLLNQPVLGSIFLMLIFMNITARHTSIIFKGQAVKLKRSAEYHNTKELHGKINGKKVIATPNNDNIENNRRYLGAFRRLNKKHSSDNSEKLITYYVFEKP